MKRVFTVTVKTGVANTTLMAAHLADFQLAQQALKEFEAGW